MEIKEKRDQDESGRVARDGKLAKLANKKKSGPPRAKFLCDIDHKPIDWLWTDRVPVGMVTVLEGDPGLGKSTVAIDLAARVTRGQQMPGDKKGVRVPSGVLIIGTEEDRAAVVRPRFEAAGGDLKRIKVSSLEHPPVFPRDLSWLEDELTDFDARLVILDSMFGVIQPGLNSNQDEDMRRMLQPLASLAAKAGVSILMIRHLNKGSSLNTGHRGMGSTAIGGVARSVLVLHPHPNDENHRCLAVVKSNNAPLKKTIDLVIERQEGSFPKIFWGDEVEISAHELNSLSVSGGSERPRSTAGDFLKSYLREGPRWSKEILKEAETQGVCERTLRRASKELGVSKCKREEGKWYWALG